MEERRKVILAGAGFIIFLAAAIVVYLVFFRGGHEAPTAGDTAEPVQEQSEPAEPPAAEVGSPETLNLELDASDEPVRELARSLSQRPELERWLRTGDLIRKFVAAVDNIAGGQSPRSHIDFFAVDEPFAAVQKDGRWYMDPEGFHRYDTVAQVFASLDPGRTVDLYRRLKPVLQDAYREMGYPTADFEATLMRAVDELLRVPVVEGDVALEEKLESYELASARLEELSPAQKHLFRMGPENIRRIQSQLRALKALLQTG
jgi:hypothetical protein